MRRIVPIALALALLAPALLAPSAAQACAPRVVEGERHPRCVGFKGQAQISVRAAMSPRAELGLVSLNADFSLSGIGIRLGYGYEHLVATGVVPAHGGFFELGLQWRPVQSFTETAYRMIDPFIALGGLVGGANQDGEGLFRGAALLDVGVDIALSAKRGHPVLHVGYRYHLAQVPEWAPAHLFTFGLGWRGA